MAYCIKRNGLTDSRTGRGSVVVVEGLVDTNSEHEFDSKLHSLAATWANFEKLRAKKSKSMITFYDWFCKYYAEEIKSTMLRSVREAAGLGDPPSEFCTNDSEAINSALKQFLAFKKSDWPIFNKKMRKFVSSQEAEVCKLIISLGQYCLKEEYQHFSVAPSRWFASLSDDQRKDVQKKFQQASVDDRQDPSSIEEVSSVADKEKFSSMYKREQHSPVDDQAAFDPILMGNVSDDHLQESNFPLSQQTDNPPQGTGQQGYVLPVDTHNASQITG